MRACARRGGGGHMYMHPPIGRLTQCGCRLDANCCLSFLRQAVLQANNSSSVGEEWYRVAGSGSRRKWWWHAGVHACRCACHKHMHKAAAGTWHANKVSVLPPFFKRLRHGSCLCWVHDSNFAGRLSQQPHIVVRQARNPHHFKTPAWRSHGSHCTSCSLRHRCPCWLAGGVLHAPA